MNHEPTSTRSLGVAVRVVYTVFSTVFLRQVWVPYSPSKERTDSQVCVGPEEIRSGTS